MMTDQQRIAKIQARCDAATPGPWEDSDGYGVLIFAPSEKGGRFTIAEACGLGYYSGKGTGGLGLSNKIAIERLTCNAAFIAHARDDLPWLLAQLAERDAEIERLREAQRWIPAGERLPGRDDRVLVYAEPMAGTEAAIQVSWGWACHSRKMVFTHWMPLPAPPDGGLQGE